MALDGKGRQTIGDDEGCVELTGSEKGGGLGTEAAAEIRAAEIGSAIRRGTMQQHVRRQMTGLKIMMDGVARPGVIELKTQQFGRRQTVAGTAQGDTGG